VKRGEPRPKRRRVVDFGNWHVQLVPLADIADSEPPLDVVAWSDAGARCQRAEECPQFRRYERIDGLHEADHCVPPLGGDREPECAQNTGEWRHEDALDADALCESAAVQRSAAAEGDEHASTRVDAALNAHTPQRARHRCVYRGDDGTGNPFDRGAQPSGNRAECVPRRARVQ
jgi:hypothetical protein